MKKELYRGKRVRVLSGYYQGQYGTVTHLNGDPGFETDDEDEVWVTLDDRNVGLWIDGNEILIVG